MTHFDLAVIGAGPGGYAAAIKAAQLGLSCALIEQGAVGGTCLNRGCIPTKTLLHTTELIDQLAHAADFGVQVEGVSLDYAALRARVSAVCDQLRGGVEALLAANGVKLIAGRATLGAGNRIAVRAEAEAGVGAGADAAPTPQDACAKQQG
ncbi:MAG: FAD-dependent oxidoreductase, partial [Raoultibacter sp.]